MIRYNKNEKNKKIKKIKNKCLCELLNDPEYIIEQNIFHNNICSYHYKYCKKYKNEKELYEQTERNFFVELVEYNMIEKKIRNETIDFFVEYLRNYFGE